MTRIKLEVCVDTITGADDAIKAGADRIELCAALAVGGITPSAGLMKAASKLERPIYAMIRPRGGDFIFSDAEMDVMLADIDCCRENNMDGIVIGITHENGALNYKNMKKLIDHAEGLGVTMHRAFDVTPDPMEALEIAVELGVERILTSGQRETLLEGAEMINKTIEKSAGRLSIMPCSQVNAGNIETILKTLLPISEIHSACKSLSVSPYLESAPSMAEGDDFSRYTTDPKRVKALVDKLKILRQ